MGILRSELMHRYLDPASSLGEVLFGLIMTLTFTLGAGLMIQEEGAEGDRALLIATIGCNIAWGVIDGALYIVGQLFDRGRVLRVGQRIRATPDDAEAIRLVAAEMDEMLEPVTTTEERQALYGRVLAHVRQRQFHRGRVTRSDLSGALICFWLVFFASFPAAIPFIFIDDSATFADSSASLALNQNAKDAEGCAEVAEAVAGDQHRVPVTPLP